MDNTKIMVNDLVQWLREKVKEAGAEGVVFGLSGGIDSAVTAGVAKLAFPEDSLGLIMPCHSNIKDEEHALLVANNLNLKVDKIDLGDTFDIIKDSATIDVYNKLAIANIKPRLRMTTLYYYAQSYNYLVVGPTNRSEFIIGYFTKHGDSGVDLLPLANLTKTKIWEMARYLNIPKIIINKDPSAGLWEEQTDEEEMGFSYEILDRYIETGQGPKEVISKIENMHKISTHKRKYPPIYKGDEIL